MTKKVIMSADELERLLTKSAKLGASYAINDIAVYQLKDAAALMNISYVTLKKRIDEGKIQLVDGRITGHEIRKYLGLI